MYHVPFTDTELICRYLHSHDLTPEPFLTGEKELDAFSPEQIQNFRNDILMHFAQNPLNVHEDVAIPEGMDTRILREARYLRTIEHDHEYIEFIYLLQGECTEYIGDHKYKMKTGDLFLLAPGTKHHGEVLRDDTLLFYIMVRRSTFDSAFLSLLRYDDALSVFFSEIIFKQQDNRFFMFHTGENKRLQDIVYSMYRGSDRTDIISIRRTNILFELICLEVIEHHLENIHTREKKSTDLSIMSVITYVDENLEDVSVETVATHFGYSRGHMDRLVKANTGYTLSDFILRVKMRHARNLLRNPSLTIHEVAEYSGFMDDSSFYRAFKKYYNQTPSEYRRHFSERE